MSRPDSILAQLRPAGGWYATTRAAGTRADAHDEPLDERLAVADAPAQAGAELAVDEATAMPVGWADDEAVPAELPVADGAEQVHEAPALAVEGPAVDVDEPRRGPAAVPAPRPVALPTSRKPGPGPWVEQGACAGLDPALFFPERGESAADAKAVCAGCTVRDECLDYAVTRPEKAGVWGGTSEKERRRIRSERLAAARAQEAS